MMQPDCRQLDATVIFEELAANMSAFLSPHPKKFNTDLLIMGGSIARVHYYFSPAVRKNGNSWNRMCR
ncbi:hypothetical protein [Sinomicrobium sp. M5D2P9]